MNSLGISPDLILTSPLRRAVQTAEVVQEGLSNKGQMQFSQSLVPWTEPREILNELGEAHATERNVVGRGTRTSPQQPGISRSRRARWTVLFA